jgi:hypothetical protein
MQILSIIGVIAIIAVMAFIIISNQEANRKRDEDLKKMLFSYKDKSSTFRKQFIPIWKGDVHYNRNELEALIEKFNSDPDLKRKLEEEIEWNRKIEIRDKQFLKKVNHIAFNHIKLFRELKKVGESFSERQIQETISIIYPNQDFSVLIAHLFDNHLIKRDYKDASKIRLTFYSTVISHPYELDENGDPKIIEI